MTLPAHLINQTFRAHGTHPDGTTYDHGVSVVKDVWGIPNYPQHFGIELQDENGCGWIWPGIDRIKDTATGHALYYSPCLPGHVEGKLLLDRLP